MGDNVVFKIHTNCMVIDKVIETVTRVIDLSTGEGDILMKPSNIEHFEKYTEQLETMILATLIKKLKDA